MTRGETPKAGSGAIARRGASLQRPEYSGAYHFAGLAVECAIKACIAKQTKRFEFPNKPLADAAWRHNFPDLIKAAKLQGALEQKRQQNPAFDQNWSTIGKWQIDSRYDLSTTRRAASELIASTNQQPDGVLPWLQVYW